jgi:hypothetical protein
MGPALTYIITFDRYPELVVPGKRLGRHRITDSRSTQYRFTSPRTVIGDVNWTRHTPILDQGDVGSCTGNAMTGALATGPVYDGLPAGHPPLDETEAVKLYSQAETIDGDGPYPPNDNGSSGNSVCKAAANSGLISGWTHALTADDVLQALMGGPVILGIDWYSSFDTPAADGTIVIAPGAVVRGGHEILARRVDTAGEMVGCDNSWGQSWGAAGSMQMPYTVLEQLLTAGGDAQVPVPATQPAPVPVPPGPQPAPPPVPVADAADRVLWDATWEWTREHHTGGNRRAAQQLIAWSEAKGLLP